jgi:hypothetical protein
VYRALARVSEKLVSVKALRTDFGDYHNQSELLRMVADLRSDAKITTTLLDRVTVVTLYCEIIEA